MSSSCNRRDTSRDCDRDRDQRRERERQDREKDRGRDRSRERGRRDNKRDSRSRSWSPRRDSPNRGKTSTPPGRPRIAPAPAPVVRVAQPVASSAQLPPVTRPPSRLPPTRQQPVASSAPSPSPTSIPLQPACLASTGPTSTPNSNRPSKHLSRTVLSHVRTPLK